MKFLEQALGRLVLLFFFLSTGASLAAIVLWDGIVSHVRISVTWVP